jgi:chromosome segregation ATPase
MAKEDGRLSPLRDDSLKRQLEQLRQQHRQEVATLTASVKELELALAIARSKVAPPPDDRIGKLTTEIERLEHALKSENKKLTHIQAEFIRWDKHLEKLAQVPFKDVYRPFLGSSGGCARQG